MSVNRKAQVGFALAAGLSLLFLAACGDAEQPTTRESHELGGAIVTAPPSMPAGAVTETFERVAAQPSPASPSNGSEQVHWGIKPGEPLPIIWDNLMPEGSAEALEQEYAAFYQMLEEQYAANGPIELIEEGSELDYMPQLGGFETVSELDGVLVRIPGYVVPFDFDPR